MVDDGDTSISTGAVGRTGLGVGFPSLGRCIFDQDMLSVDSWQIGKSFFYILFCLLACEWGPYSVLELIGGLS